MYQNIRNCYAERVDTKVIDVKNVSDWKSECSSFKLKKQDVMPMLNTIVHIKAIREYNFLLYFTSYDDYCRLQKLDFLKISTLNNVANKLPEKENPRGIDSSKKESILKILVLLILENRRKFWIELLTSEET